MCSWPSLVLLILSLIVLVSMGVGIAQMTVGAQKLGNCSAETFLPIAIIISGSLLALQALSSACDAYRWNCRSSAKCAPGESERLTGSGGSAAGRVGYCGKLMEVLRWLIISATLAWAAVTLFLVLRTNAVFTTVQSASNYCDPDLVNNAIILASMAMATAGLVAVLGIACYVAC